MEIGMKFETELAVTQEMTAQAYGSGKLPVFATPRMIAMMENTAYRCVQDDLAEGQGTVGTMVNVKHVSATPIGMRVRCEAVLTGVDRRRLSFDVRAWDEAGLIGEGTHDRFIIDAEKFMRNAEAKRN